MKLIVSPSPPTSTRPLLDTNCWYDHIISYHIISHILYRIILYYHIIIIYYTILYLVPSIIPRELMMRERIHVCWGSLCILIAWRASWMWLLAVDLTLAQVVPALSNAQNRVERKWTCASNRSLPGQLNALALPFSNSFQSIVKYY